MYVELAFPMSFRNTFTYRVPEQLKKTATIGKRAAAPFGKRIVTGFIIAFTENPSIDKSEIRDIIDVIDAHPVFNELTFKFYQWIADYYICSIGEALKLSDPYGTEVRSRKTIYADPNVCVNQLAAEKRKDTIRAHILALMSDRERISLNKLKKLIKAKNINPALKKLEEDGIITVHTGIGTPNVSEKTLKYIRLLKSAEKIYEYIPEIESRSFRQVQLLLKLLAMEEKELPLAGAMKDVGIGSSSVQSLADKGILEVYDKHVERIYRESYREEQRTFVLTDDQKKVLHSVLTAFNEGGFKPFLLNGVTGSGKTLVYIEIIQEVLRKGKNALILVPEITLTPQMTARLQNVFGDDVTVLHSRLSAGERFDGWQRVMRGEARVVTGPRSALFAPLSDIGIIVVDEEHDSSYKQHDLNPRYQARDAALVYAKMLDIPIVLGSATPSIESMYNAKSGKYTLLELPKRIDDAKMPVITLVNVVEEKGRGRMENVFSKTLLEKIDSRLRRKEGVIVLQNRRGFATQLYCVECGEVEMCENCSVSLVYHINTNKLHCHYCGYTKPAPKVCSTCGSLHLTYFGAGTQRVEDELEYYFPKAAIERIDSDSVSRKGAMGAIMKQFADGEIDILTGTQIVAKGLDFPRVTLVGVIAAETNLWLPDYRADERTYQLLTQVAGRAGRSTREGEVVIQTQNDKHIVLQKVLHNDYTGLYRKEVHDRKMRRYPPFTTLCLIEAKHKDEAKVKGGMNELYLELRRYRKYIQVSPPTYAVIAKIKNEYRFQMLIRSSREDDPAAKQLRGAILESYKQFNEKSEHRDLRFSFDVNPQSIV